MAELLHSSLLAILNQPVLPINTFLDEFIRCFNATAALPEHSRWQVSVDEWQRYEFLGDRVLNLVVAGYLCDRTPACREGDMTKKMGVVSNESLAGIIERRGITITRLIPETMGQQRTYGETVTGGALEAFIGALYTMTGFEVTRTFVISLMKDEIDNFNPGTNYIGRLQEWHQQHGKALPRYTEDLGKRSGPDHALRFTYIVRDEETGVILGEGCGGTGTEARQQAAQQALKTLHCE